VFIERSAGASVDVAADRVYLRVVYHIVSENPWQCVCE